MSLNYKEKRKPKHIDYEAIERDALLAKNDISAKERLTKRLLPIIRFLTDFYKKIYLDWDESEIFYVINRSTEYAVTNHEKKRGKFIHYWRFLVKKAIVRASINHNKKKPKLVKFDLVEERTYSGDGESNKAEMISNNLFLQEVLDKGLDSLETQCLIQALLWSHSFTAKEISLICETNTTTIRRNIQKVLNFISLQS